MAAARLIHMLAEALVESGRRNGIPLEALAGDAPPPPGSHWSGDDLLRILRAVSRLMQDEFYGLATRRCPPGSSQLGIEILVTSEMLDDALERCFRFYGIATDGIHFHLSDDDGVASIEFRGIGSATDNRNFLAHWHAVRWHRLCQWLIGAEISLIHVDFPCAPIAPLHEYREVFGEGCRFLQPVARLSFPSLYLHRRIVRRPRDLQLAMASSGYDPLSSAEVDHSWKSTLKSTLRTHLAHGSTLPTLDELAYHFGVCGQTLRRRLRAERSSYRQIKAEIRREVALDGMHDERLTLGQVSIMAGFSEANGLARAIKSWTGLTPSQYRAVTKYCTESDTPEGLNASPADLRA